MLLTLMGNLNMFGAAAPTQKSGPGLPKIRRRRAGNRPYIPEFERQKKEDIELLNYIINIISGL